MKRILFIFAALITLTACVKDEKTPNGNSTDVMGISIDFGNDGNGTKGTPITNASQITSIGAWCTYTSSADWTATSQSIRFRNIEFTRSGNEWLSTPPIYWEANEITDRYTFFAYAPYGKSNTNGITPYHNTQGIPQLRYDVPSDVTKQPDLMLAEPRYNVRPVGKLVQLKMRHALTCVSFQIAGNGEKVTGISVTGISTSGQTEINGNNISWALGSKTTADFSASLNFDAGKNYYTATPTMSTNLIAGNGYLMMLPQTIQSNAKATITFDDGSSRTIALGGSGNWLVGKKVTYMITLLPSGTVTVSPSELLLPWNVSRPGHDNITVSCLDNNGNQAPSLPWKLTSGASWFSLTLNSNGSNPSSSVSGTGSTTVYTVVPTNLNTTARTTTVSLDDNNNPSTAVVKVVQQATLQLDNTAGQPIDNSYVGAFWKASQKGERIIRIPVDANSAGDWSAYVYYFDGRWTNGDIVLSTDLLDATTLAARGITWNSSTENPQDAENTLVAGSQSIVVGTAAANSYITFRIGLKSTYSSTTSYPARYAVVVLSYKNNTKWQKIYLRQGEDADYVIAPSDVASTQSSYIKKFSPYNLTSPNMGSGGTNLANHGTTAYKGGVFVDYPSQMGAFWQWANSFSATYTRRAYHPVNPAGSITSWLKSSANNYWNTASTTHETCPSGYRRPNDGSTSAISNGDVAGSEVRQSLYETPPSSGDVLTSGNFVIGFYADGFFDRRDHNSPAIGSSSTSGKAVSWSTAAAAYTGMLFYNSKQSSSSFSNSLFFPMGGYRIDNDGSLNQSGNTALYWTGSSYNDYNNGGHIWSLCTYATYSGMRTPTRYSGVSIRCVKE